MNKKILFVSFALLCFTAIHGNSFAGSIVKKSVSQNTTVSIKKDNAGYKLQVTDFSLPVVNAKGSGYKTVKLSDFKGKTVLVNFFATWCPPCRAETPMLVKFYNEHKKDNIVFIGITSKDNLGQSLNSFIKEFKVDYPVVYGGQSLFADYHIFGLPTSYIIKPNGHILTTQIGDVNHYILNGMLGQD